MELKPLPARLALDSFAGIVSWPTARWGGLKARSMFSLSCPMGSASLRKAAEARIRPEAEIISCSLKRPRQCNQIVTLF